MSRLAALFLVAVVASPSAAQADDLAALFPDATQIVFGVEVKGVQNSPLGKKIIGTDNPFDAARKLIQILLPDDALPIAPKAIKPLELVANKLDRATLAIADGSGLLIFLEGDIVADEYAKAAEAIAGAYDSKSRSENLGDHKLFVIDGEKLEVYGLRLSKTLFVIANKRDLIAEVLDRHAGKKKANLSKQLTTALKKVKPADSPVWLAVGVDHTFLDLTGLATITLKENIDFRIEIVLDGESGAATLKQSLEAVVENQTKESTPQAKVWKAAGIVVKQDGKVVVATGSIPGKLLADEYAKQK